MHRVYLAFSALLPACVVYADGVPPVQAHAPPSIEYADGSCYYDEGYRSFTWWFEADVTDTDGPYDVVAVWADVYDDWDGALVDSFELYREERAYWYSDWDQSSTGLDCDYYDYTVEFVAYDAADWHDSVAFEMF